MQRNRFWIIASIVVVLAFLVGIFGCAQATTTTTQATQSTTTQVAPITTSQLAQTTLTTPTTVAALPVLKIGLITNMGNPVGLDFYHGAEVSADMDNAAGGLLIGGQRYNVQLTSYDTKLDEPTGIAALNRLIFVDDVKFVIVDSNFSDAYAPIVEANHVVMISSPPITNSLMPNYHFSFDSGMFEMATVAYGWLGDNYPNIKTIATGATDNVSGHALIAQQDTIAKVFGQQLVYKGYYDPTSIDLSAMGLKIAAANPDALQDVGGGEFLNSLLIKGAKQAGYKGMVYSEGWEPVGSLLSFCTAATLEGFVGGAWPTEFNPASTPTAQAFKQAWIVKFGSWQGQDIHFLTDYWILRAALMQTGSLNTDTVAAAIGNGLTFDAPEGPGQMVPRPDLGNTRTVSAVTAYPFKKITGGKAVQIGAVTLANAVKYFEEVWK